MAVFTALIAHDAVASGMLACRCCRCCYWTSSTLFRGMIVHLELGAVVVSLSVLSSISRTLILIVPRVGRYGERISGGARYVEIRAGFGVSKRKPILELD